ncbi:hypothetical protein U472_09905 [Orenia metallireducens]|uniref:Phage tail tape measure protein n=1 Tax=Orenia metallireducens TaxID=1413210 RepID=A0A1C0A7T3_9FIRM|nr:hypothetical protein [Orenia metallireducens]OCL26313.1 hypothetical protein U472_09905 [Orenia metallireducens]
MAETIRGINVKIGSDTTGLGKALKDVNKKSRDIRSELRKVQRLLRFNPDDTRLLAQQQELLSQRVGNTSEKLERLRSVQEQVNEQFQNGEISAEAYRDFQRELVRTESQLNSFREQLDNAGQSSSTLAQRIQATGERLQGVGNKLKGIGKKLSGMSAAITGAFTGLVVGTRDFRKEIAVLENNTKTAGANMENMSAAMKQMQGVTGELDSNVEGLSNLLAAGFKGDKFQQVLDELSGAAIKFKDTLKFEGIADGLQETLATGSAVGPFAELLERSGIQIDNFNAGLQQAITSGTEQNYILETLANTGLANVYEQYRQNNSELVNSAEANYSLQESLSKLGKTLEPIMTQITIAITKVVDVFNNLSPVGKKIALIFGGIATAIGPVLVTVGSMITAWGTLSTTFATVSTFVSATLIPALSGMAAPILGTVAAVGGLIAIGIEVVRHWEKVKSLLKAVFDTLKSIVKIVVNVWKLEFKSLEAFVLTVVDTIVQKLSVLEKIPKVGDQFAGLSDAIGDSAEKSRQEVVELANEIKKNGKAIASSTVDVGKAFGDLGSSVGKDLKNVTAKVFDFVTGTQIAYAAQSETIEEEQEKQTNAVKEGNKDRVESTSESEEEQTEKVKGEVKKRAEAREEFEDSWNNKLFNLTASRMEILEREKAKAIAEAKAKGASTEAIEQYYAQKKNEIRESYEESWQNKLFRLTANKEQLLELEKQRALARAEELGVSKQAILEYYAQKEQELLSTQLANYQNHGNAISAAVAIWKDSVKNYVTNLKNNTAEASMAMAKSMTGFFDSFANGTKTFREAVKEMALSFVTMAEQQVIAAQAAGIAASWAQAPLTFGASLAYIGQIAAAVAPALATFETVKAVIRKFADGGVVTGPTVGLIGEAGDDEAVIPLRKDVLANLGAGIAAHMPMPQQQEATVSTRPIEVTLQVGTLIADDLGLKKLERKLRSIRISENARLGVNTR